MTQHDHHKLFSDKSDIYAAARPTYPTQLYEYVTSLCNDTERVWDVACGNGQASIGLSRYFDEVEATDVSKEQIANAKQRANVRYQVISAENPPFPDNHFDLVTVAQALHWFDYGKFWPQVRRMLKSNGVFAAWGYSWFKVIPNSEQRLKLRSDAITVSDLDSMLEKHFFDVIRPYWAKHNQLLWDGYANVPFPFTRLETPDFVMDMHWSLDDLFNYLHTWSATRRCMDDLGGEFFSNARTQTASVWGDPATKQLFRISLCMLVGRASI